MKRFIPIIASILLSFPVALKAQIGIGTVTPSRALEVFDAPGVPPMKFTNLNSASANTASVNLKSLVVDSSGDVTVGLPKGALIASMSSSRTTTLAIAITATAITFDTDNVVAVGTISRSGGSFTIGTNGDGLYTFTLRPQTTTSATNSAASFLRMWAIKNGTEIVGTTSRYNHFGVSKSQRQVQTYTLNLVAGDVITFSAIASVVNIYSFDNTAAASPIPSDPAVLIDIKGYNR
jgi:hypothetical protein